VYAGLGVIAASAAYLEYLFLKNNSSTVQGQADLPSTVLFCVVQGQVGAFTLCMSEV